MPKNLFQKGEGIQRIKNSLFSNWGMENLEIWNDGRMKILYHPDP